MKHSRIMAVGVALIVAGAAVPAAAGPITIIIKKPPPKGAPGPIAAAGLPFLLAAGAIAFLRRRRLSH